MTATASMADRLKSPAATTLTPHLVCRDAASAIEFYRRAFGAEEMRVIRAPDGKILHAALLIGGAMFFLNEEFPAFGSKGPQTLGGTPVMLHLHVEDCDAVFDRAARAGCAVRMPLADMFWGDRYGVLVDPFGHTWSVATTVRELTTEQMQSNAAAACAAMNGDRGGCEGAAR
jgi:uncharacterized glyoxalase superfamily protein PhnB